MSARVLAVLSAIDLTDAQAEHLWAFNAIRGAVLIDDQPAGMLGMMKVWQGQSHDGPGDWDGGPVLRCGDPATRHPTNWIAPYEHNQRWHTRENGKPHGQNFADIIAYTPRAEPRA